MIESRRNGKNKGSRVSSKLVCIEELLVGGERREKCCITTTIQRHSLHSLKELLLCYLIFNSVFPSFFCHTSDVCREISLCMYDQMDLKLKFTAQGNIANHAD
jgi:hypothetical protein